jgi:hypothetical protein
MRVIKIIPWIAPFLCVVQTARSQNPISVTATANRNQILIGEPVQITLEAKLPLGRQITWFPLDSIPHFEYIEKGTVDSVVDVDGRSYRQDITVTSFDSGAFYIRPFVMTIDNRRYLTDSIPVQVSFSKINPGQDYHDIKDILDVETPAVKYVIWCVIAGTILSILLTIYFVRKKKEIVVEVQVEAPPPLAAYDEAMLALNELKNQELAKSGQVKAYYTRLNDIFRRFVLRKLQIASMAKTNDELILQLRNTLMPRDKFSELAETLRMSDFVKFAKYVPEQSERDRSFTVIRSSIDILNELERSAV